MEMMHHKMTRFYLICLCEKTTENWKVYDDVSRCVDGETVLRKVLVDVHVPSETSNKCVHDVPWSEKWSRDG